MCSSEDRAWRNKIRENRVIFLSRHLDSANPHLIFFFSSSSMLSTILGIMKAMNKVATMMRTMGFFR